MRPDNADHGGYGRVIHGSRGQIHPISIVRLREHDLGRETGALDGAMKSLRVNIKLAGRPKASLVSGVEIRFILN
jgi:hypothetical protein